MTKDEKAAQKEAKEYLKAIEEYGLDNIEDGWGQSRKRYMIDSFYAGFYAGRDYQRDKVSDKNIEKVIDKLIELMKSKEFDRLKWFNTIEELRL